MNDDSQVEGEALATGTEEQRYGESEAHDQKVKAI